MCYPTGVCCDDPEVTEMWASSKETADRFRAETCPYAPADEGDVRFEPFDAPADAMEETPYGLRMIDDKGECFETHYFVSARERGDMIASFRYAQEVPFEVEFAPFGPAWEREQERQGAYA